MTGAPKPLPGWVKPQLTRVVDQQPDGPDWLHEIKYDGYRMHARLDRGAVRLLTRSGLNWTHKYPAIASAVSSLPARQAYLDGELAGFRPDKPAADVRRLVPHRKPIAPTRPPESPAVRVTRRSHPLHRNA
jgi:ATP-dependent DNA ligase